jgi:tRNA 5-methylaminomethyl-2-thiouridine biosynthesis bifunctional protein
MGQKVTLIEECDRAAQGASGNSAGIYYPFLSADLNQTTQIFLQAYHRTLHDLDRFQLMSCVTPIGMINLTQDKKEQIKMLTALNTNPEFSRWIKAVDETEVSNAFSQLIQRVGIAFPKSGYVNPKALCEQLIQHPLISHNFNQEVTRIVPIEKHWQVITRDHEHIFDAVVICNSYKAQQLLPAHFLPCIKVRGQTLQLPMKDTGLALPDCVICDQIYIIPMAQDTLYLGATFDRNDDNQHPTLKSQQELIEKLEKLTGCTLNKTPAPSSRVGFRLCSVDRLPFVGPLPKLEDFFAQYQDLWQGKHPQHYPAASYWPNLYLNIAHGARGITSSFLSASIISEYINQQPLSLPNHLAQQLHPARFLIREFKKPPEKRLPFVQTLAKSAT